RLASALGSLTAFAQNLHAPSDTMDTLRGLHTSLHEPFMFVVVGEVKAGKSSLLNALFGREFCRVDVLPATDKIHVFKYGETEQDVAITDRLMERYRPNIFLRDFNIVDTPGTNTIVVEHQTITEKFLPLADLVMFVFSITNPWAASGWDFLNLVHKRWLKNVVFILQQVDLRSETEVAAIVTHFDQTLRERLGASFPIFAVSAKKALAAKTVTPDPALLAESNIDKLESYINDAVARGEMRAEKLRSVCQTSQVILGELCEKAQGAYSVLRKDMERLQQLEMTMEDRKTQSMRQVDGLLWTLAQSYERSQRRGETLLREKLSLTETFKLILRKQQWQRQFQADLEAALHESFVRQIQNAVDLLQGDLKNVWRQLHESVRKNFDPSVATGSNIPDFLDERNVLLKKIELTLMEKMSGAEVEAQLKKLFVETATWLRLPAGVAAASGLATLALALAHAAIVDVTGTIAGVAAVAGTVVAVLQRQKILAEFRDQMAAKRNEVLSAIEDHLRHAIELFYQELTATFLPLKNFCAAERKIYEPMITEMRELQLTFDRLAPQL
ncbi:MAG: dynamin family protein, partial [Verrucomicrobiota bacterium]|nr:dynamin family protein [Verrucomicrobiota bacterium]